MIETNNPELNVAQLLHRIRDEVARRPATGSLSDTAPTAPSPDSGLLPTLPRAEDLPPLSKQSVYALRDFLNYHDKAFIVNAYRGVLRRDPDPSGMDNFLNQLRNGDYTKIEILGRLRFSAEGRRQAVRIQGLGLPFAVQTACRLPVFGYGIAWLNAILRLPLLIKNGQRFETHTAFRIDQNYRAVADPINRISQIIGQLQRDLGQTHRPELDDLHAQLKQLGTGKVDQQSLADLQQQFHGALAQTASQHQLAEAVQQGQDAIAQLHQQLHDRLTQTVSPSQLAAVHQQFDDRLTVAQQQIQDALAAAAVQQQHTLQTALGDLRQQIFEQKRTILDQQRRLGLLLEEARKRLPAPLNADQLTTWLTEDEHRLDAMYATFEDQFRGTRADIKQRLEIYLPLIRQCQAGTDTAPVLDVGCGRGEWLELLRDQHLIAHGVDLNQVFAQQCRDDQLRVIEQDAIAYLRSLPDQALGAITGFHIIEHLPIRTLIALFDEVLRVLRPGGVVIFETPNPNNLLVSSCNFYLDPTHRNPLPAPLSRYLIEARGLVRAEIIELHPFDAALQFSDGPPATITRLNQHFFGPQDYAVVAYKA